MNLAAKGLQGRRFWPTGFKTGRGDKSTTGKTLLGWRFQSSQRHMGPLLRAKQNKHDMSLVFL